MFMDETSDNTNDATQDVTQNEVVTEPVVNADVVVESVSKEKVVEPVVDSSQQQEPIKEDPSYTLDEMVKLRQMFSASKTATPKNIVPDVVKRVETAPAVKPTNNGINMETIRDMVQSAVKEVMPKKQVDPMTMLADYVKDKPDMAAKLSGLIDVKVKEGKEKEKPPSVTFNDVSKKHNLSEHDRSALSTVSIDEATMVRAFESKEVVDALLYRSGINAKASNRTASSGNTYQGEDTDYSNRPFLSNVIGSEPANIGDLSDLKRSSLTHRDDTGMTFPERAIAAVAEDHNMLIYNNDGAPTKYGRDTDLSRRIMKDTGYVKTERDPIVVTRMPNGKMVPIAMPPISSNVRNILSKDNDGRELKSGDFININDVMNKRVLVGRDRQEVDQYTVGSMNVVNSVLESQGLHT